MTWDASVTALLASSIPRAQNRRVSQKSPITIGASLPSSGQARSRMIDITT
jgi:hypothetical protein